MKKARCARLKKRRGLHARFRLYGLSAIAFALLALSVLSRQFELSGHFCCETYPNVGFTLCLRPAVICPEGKDTPAGYFHATWMVFTRSSLKSFRYLFPKQPKIACATRQLGDLVYTSCRSCQRRNGGWLKPHADRARPANDQGYHSVTISDLYLKGCCSERIPGPTGRTSSAVTKLRLGKLRLDRRWRVQGASVPYRCAAFR